MVQQTSLSPAEIQARLNQADEIMARINQSNQQAADHLSVLASSSAGNIYNRHHGSMSASLEDLQTATNHYQQLIDYVKSGNAKFQQYDA